MTGLFKPKSNAVKSIDYYSMIVMHILHSKYRAVSSK